MAAERNPIAMRCPTHRRFCFQPRLGLPPGWRRIALAALLLWQAALLRGQGPLGAHLAVSVVDQKNQAVAGVRIELTRGAEAVASAETGKEGFAEFKDLLYGHYGIAALKEGFEPLRRADLDLSIQSASLEMTLIPVLGRENVEVRATLEPMEQGASAPAEMPAQAARDLPSRPATVSDALPMTPGVVRENGGALAISAGAEHRSAMIVNSADVTDPATGQFGLTVPMDSVEEVDVYQTAYLAEYGRFTAGLVSVATRRGGDKWKWELNDPLPEFRIRSWHLRGLKDATPRLNFEGPLLTSKLNISEGVEYEVRRTAVYTLPFPYNQKKQEGFNSFTQLDWAASAKQWVTATVHLAPERLGFVNMDYFNPQPTAPDASTHNYTGTVAHHLAIFGGVFENTFSMTRFDASVWGQGPADLIVTPSGNLGNYFAQTSRDAKRFSGTSNYSFVPIEILGTHNLKIGVYAAGSTETGEVAEHPIEILDASGQLTEQIAFPRTHQFQISDTEYAAFAQDHWIVSPRLALDLGVRTESQQVSGAVRVALRSGVSWRPFSGAGAVVRAGFGLFYDRVPLNVYCFNKYPDRVITMYDDGVVSAGPFLYLNTLGQSKVKSPFVRQQPIDGNFSPRSAIWSVQVEQPLARSVKLRLGYMRNDAAGLVLLDTVAPDPVTNTGAYLLEGAGESRYWQLEATTRVGLSEGRQLFFSYVRSHANGDLNDFEKYLGAYPVPVIRDNRSATLSADLPNRFLAWGSLQLPWKAVIYPMLEYRNGFPYIVTDAAQNYVGIPNQDRFPNFFSLDSRLSKDIQVSKKYAVRLSLSAFNLSNHFNPEAVHSNVADPAYGYFFGHRGRRFTVDFDFLY